MIGDRESGLEQVVFDAMRALMAEAIRIRESSGMTSKPADPKAAAVIAATRKVQGEGT